ncbi:MAG: response regulator [Thiovulaceae bacterium]|nr:response regulator [Sulfurimonadaceae bacterium]
MNKYEDIEYKKLAYLYDNLKQSTIGLFGVSTVIFFLFKGEVTDINLNIWYISLTFTVIGRLILYRKYKGISINKVNFTLFKNLFTISVVVSATLWGIIPIMIFPENIIYQIFLVMMLGGMTSAASASLATNNMLYLLFVLISMIPFMYVIITLDNPIYKPLFITMVMYIIFLISSSKKMYELVNNSIALSYKNRDLIEKLEIKAEEANRAADAKSNFLSTMSHEIRTPLNAIIGFIKVLKQTEKDNKRLKYLNTIDESSYSLLNIINDILDFSKIESGKFRLDFTEFNPKKELQNIFELYLETASRNNITLINSISKDLPQNIRTDKLRLKQIISNLISNAIKFTPENKKVEFIAKFNKDTSSLYIEIKDEGIGIEKEKIPLITNEFTQADSTTARKYGGTGLGLSIVLKLLRLLKSELFISSELGKGSRFFFSINIQVLEFQDKIKEFQDEDVSFANKKILVAEDNKTNQMLVKLLLSDMYINVTIANDGLEAEKYFKENKFDLVLMDINMPNKNGIEAMEDINKYQNNFQNKVPIIALTANAVSGDKEKYLDYGFDNYLAKPIDNEQLLSVLKEYLT